MGHLSPRNSSHAYRPLSLKRRAWLTVGAVVLGGAGVVTVAVANPSDSPEPSKQTPAQVKDRPAEVHKKVLKALGSGKLGIARTETEQFSLLGVSWANEKAELDGTAQVRTRPKGTDDWTGWKDLDFDQHAPESAEGRQAAVRGASEPLWVGPSDAVEARVVAGDGTTTAGLPKGLRLDLVDPGVKGRRPAGKGTLAAAPAAFSAVTDVTDVSDTTEETPTPTAPESPAEPAPSEPEPTPTEPTPPADPTSPTPAPTPTEPTPTPSATPTVPTAPPSTVNRPPIVTRAQWGADESMVEDPPAYIDEVQAVFVHHTTGTNAYSCADSPALVRGIMAYHIESSGWNDLGYNFIVDKCGTIFEGRAGGADLPVMGAHTYGFNSYSAGVAVLGDYHTGGKPSAAALQAVARVAAWKHGQYGGDPQGKVTLTAAEDTGVWRKGEQATLNQISGHRDGFATACPGEYLYAKLPYIRDYAASPAANAIPATSDLHQDGVADFVAGTPRTSSWKGSITVLPGGVDGPVAARKQTITQASPGVPGSAENGDDFGLTSAFGDVNGDGYADLAVGSPAEDDTSGHADAGSVIVLNGPALTSGTTLSTATSTRAAGEHLGAAVTVGDFNSDGKADVLAVATGKPGRWWSFDSATGAKKSGYLNSSAYSGSVSHADAATGDFNKDGYADVAVNFRDPNGISRVLWLKGSSSGLQRVGVLSARGGRSIAAGDIDGDGYTDIAVGQPYHSESNTGVPGGAVTAIYGSASGLTSTGTTKIHQNTSGVPGANENGDGLGMSVSVGDYNADGFADVLAGLPLEDISVSGSNRKDAGSTVLLRGTSGGLTGSGALSFTQQTSGITGTSEAGDRLGSSVVLHDLSGWGRADLAIGVEGEDSWNGVILQLDSGSAGISTSNEVYYTRTTMGTPTGAHLGQTLTP